MSFQSQAGCHGTRDLGGFHAKPELYSRKEWEVLQNPLSPELSRANAPPNTNAGGPEAEGGEPGGVVSVRPASRTLSQKTGTVRLEQEELSVGINGQ